jgi:hypothetical protein
MRNGSNPLHQRKRISHRPVLNNFSISDGKNNHFIMHHGVITSGRLSWGSWVAG